MSPTVDSGWSWVVMIASAVINIVIFGVMKSGGLFYVALMEELKVSRSKAALCSSLIYSLSCLLAPLTAYLCAWFPYKTLVFSGALFASAGMAMAALVPLSFATALIFYGIFTGVGLGFVVLPNVTVVHNYFDKHRAFALGFSMAGASVGAFAVPPVFEFVLQKHNLQAGILVLSACILQICPCGLLFRVQKQKTLVRVQERQTASSFISFVCEKQLLFIFYSYIVFAIVWSGYLTFLQEYALSETRDDVSPIMAVSVLSAMSSGDLVGRLVFGWISDRGWVQRQHAYTFFLAISGLLLFCYAANLSYASLMVLSVGFGAFISGVIVLSSVILYDHCGPIRFQRVFGFAGFVNGVVVMLAAPSLAYIRELSGTYKTCFLIMGFCFVSSSAFWIVDEIYCRFCKPPSEDATNCIEEI